MLFAERNRVMSGRTVARNSEVEAHGLQHLSTTKKKKKSNRKEKSQHVEYVMNIYVPEPCLVIVFVLKVLLFLLPVK